MGKYFTVTISILISTVLFFSLAPVCAQNTVIKIALVTPEGSAWTKTLRKMVDEVRLKTRGEIELRVYAGGISGDELDVIRKIQAGRIDAAGFSGVGLGILLPKMRILEAPLLYRSYDEIDFVKERLYGEFEREFEKKGYVLLGFAEAGFVYFFSSHDMSGLDYLKKIKMWVWKGDPVAQTFFSALGIKMFPLHLADVNTGLETGMIDSFYSPTLAAVAFQWYPKAKYMLDYPMVNSTGAIVVSKNVFDRLSPENRSVLKDAAKKYCAELINLTRRDNDEARTILKQSGIKFILPSIKEVSFLEESAKKTYETNIPELYSKDLFDKVMNILNEFRDKRKVFKIK
jgi:TRAP-type C4-dicarboxylate transport system substrate-binding protein